MTERGMGRVAGMVGVRNMQPENTYIATSDLGRPIRPSVSLSGCLSPSLSPSLLHSLHLYQPEDLDSEHSKRRILKRGCFAKIVDEGTVHN